MAGKGSKARPFSVSKEVFDNNWQNIFKKKDIADGNERKQSEESNKQLDADQDRQDTPGPA
jgi:hypothetical protein